MQGKSLSPRQKEVIDDIAKKSGIGAIFEVSPTIAPVTPTKAPISVPSVEQMNNLVKLIRANPGSKFLKDIHQKMLMNFPLTQNQKDKVDEIASLSRQETVFQETNISIPDMKKVDMYKYFLGVDKTIKFIGSKIKLTTGVSWIDNYFEKRTEAIQTIEMREHTKGFGLNDDYILYSSLSFFTTPEFGVELYGKVHSWFTMLFDNKSDITSALSQIVKEDLFKKNKVKKEKYITMLGKALVLFDDYFFRDNSTSIVLKHETATSISDLFDSFAKDIALDLFALSQKEKIRIHLEGLPLYYFQKLQKNEPI
jgi:hypothetical protein